MDCIEQVWKRATALRKRSRQLLALAIATAALSHSQVYGQTFAEWFKQKKTQKQYLLQQISALMTYRQYALKGYNTAKGGLGAIGHDVSEEYERHHDHYTRLRRVNTPVKSEPQVKVILSRQQDILKLIRQITKQDALTAAETRFVNSVCTALLGDCDGQMSDLQTVIGDSKITMSDEERLRHIGRIHQAMQDNYRFAAAFSDQLKIYALQKQQEQKDANILKHLYGKVN